MNSGAVQTLNKCIEKLEAPNALFTVNPIVAGQQIIGCLNTPISFTNLSTSNSGNGQLYYNWNFGDGSFSSEFEPTHQYANSGEYLVILEVYNGCSCVDFYQFPVFIDSTTIPLDCPSVVCEGAIETYTTSIDCRPQYFVTGGEVVEYTDHYVTVAWNAVDASGFGLISIQAADCSSCILSLIHI